MMDPKSVTVSHLLATYYRCAAVSGWWSGLGPTRSDDTDETWFVRHIEHCTTCQVSLVTNRLEES